MKKLIFGGLFLLAIGIGFLACKKEQKTIPSYQNNSDLISEISQEFQASQQLEKKIDLQKLKKVVAADLKGSLSGAAKGAALGLIVPGLATGAGAVLGASIEGVASSIEKSAELEGIIASPPTGNNIGIPNANNPYDVAGHIHYSAMDNALATPLEYIDQQGVISYQNYEDLVFQKISEMYQNLDFAKPQFNATVFLNDIHLHGNSQESLASFLLPSNPTLSSLSSDALQVLVDYSDALESASDPVAFMNYSINCENIVNYSTLSNEDKMMVLIFMATARYGVGFYNQYL